MLLAELLSTRSDWIVTYHEHDSLLENRLEETLTEDERKAAWEEYEKEKLGAYMSSSFGSISAGCNREPVSSSLLNRGPIGSTLYDGHSMSIESISKSPTNTAGVCQLFF